MIPAGSNYFKSLLDSERLCIMADSSGVKIADGTGQMANVVIADIIATTVSSTLSIKFFCQANAQPVSKKYRLC